MREELAGAQRVVVKIGSSLLTNAGAGLDREAVADWAGQIAALRARGVEVLVVSSGAIAEGMKRLAWTKRPSAVNELQAAAAVGQMGLVQMWESCFAERGLRTAQVLLTHEDLGDRRRYLNARTTLKTLVGLGVVPVINENDTVVVDEIRFGDNDTLASLVTNLIEADTLAILTDQKGLFSADPRKDPAATLVSRATAGDPALEAMAGGAGSEIGSGGMITKVLAARRAARSGAHTVIAWGREPELLTRLFAGEPIGSLLVVVHPGGRGPQAVARRPPEARRPHHARPGRREGAHHGREEPARHRRDGGGRRVRARRRRERRSPPTAARSRAGS